MRKCSVCGQLKDSDEFGRDKRSGDGLRSNCKACKRAESQKQRERHPEYYQQWRDEHKAEAKKYHATWHVAHKKEVNAKRAAWATLNSEHTKNYKKDWYKKNRDKVIERKRRRRDREIVCGEVYSREHERITLKAFGNKCFKCSSKDQLHIDHHRPLVKGYALSLSNAVVLCEFCNKSKGTKDPEEFYSKSQCIKLDKKLAQIKSAKEK